MMRVDFDNSDPRVADWLHARTPRVVEELRLGMMRAITALARYTARQKVSRQVVVTRSEDLRSRGRSHEPGIRTSQLRRRLIAKSHAGRCQEVRDGPAHHHQAFALPLRSLRTSLQARRAAIVNELQQAINRGLA